MSEITPKKLSDRQKLNYSEMPEFEVPEGAFCERPFTDLRMAPVRSNDHVGHQKMEPCCTSWHKMDFGKIGDGKSQKEVFNSDNAKAFRESILDGSYKYCNKNVCPRIISKGNIWPWVHKNDIKDPYFRDIIDNNKVDGLAPRRLSFDWDVSCNLRCPSCRVGLIRHRKGTGPYNKLKKIQDEAVNLCLSNANYNDRIHFNITGTGDAIGSTLYREFLQEFDGRPWKNLTISIMTNGVMLTPKIWKTLWKVHGNIDRIEISIDAGNEEAYKKTRVGGHWPTLMKNLEFLSNVNVNRAKPFKFWLKAVTQKNNFRSIPDLVKLGDSLPGVTEVNVNRVFNWGTWTDKEFKDHAVWQKNHPDYAEMAQLFKQDWAKSPKFNQRVCFEEL